MLNKDDGNMRSFTSGATRDTNEGKLDYEGFLSPDVLKQFARFMNMNRLQSDGNLRDSDNWQKGIPMDVYRKSLSRHYMEFFLETRHRDDVSGSRLSDIHLVASACGMMFNTMGYLLEWLKENEEVRFDDDEPTTEMAARRKKINESDVADMINTQAEKVKQLMDFPKEDDYCEECGWQECECVEQYLKRQEEEAECDGCGSIYGHDIGCSCNDTPEDDDEDEPVYLTEVSPEYLKRTSVICTVPACRCVACETSRKMKGQPELDAFGKRLFILPVDNFTPKEGV